MIYNEMDTKKKIIQIFSDFFFFFSNIFINSRKLIICIVFITKDSNITWYLSKLKKGMKKYNYKFDSTFYTQ